MIDSQPSAATETDQHDASRKHLLREIGYKP